MAAHIRHFTYRAYTAGFSAACFAAGTGIAIWTTVK